MNNREFKSKTTAFDFQSRAIKLLKKLDYGGIFFEQGLGKTKIAIELILYWLKERQVDLVIVVTKKGLIKNWEEEISLHSFLSHAVLQQNRKMSSALFLSGINLLVTNYEVINSQHRKLLPLSRLKKLGIILDESAKIKNPNSKLSKIFFSLIDIFKKRFILTGTPSANRPYDIWSQIKFLDNGLSLNIPYEMFVEQTDLKNTLNDDIQGQEAFSDNLTSIFSKIDGFCIRETKEENLKDLPEKRFLEIKCPWEKNQKELYEKFKEEFKAFVKKNNSMVEENTSNILKRIIRLMQVTSNPSLVDDNYSNITEKYNELKKLIHSIIEKDEKCIVWSSYVKNIDFLHSHFEKLGAVKIHGKINIDKRNENLYEFKNNKDIRILFATPQSCKEGLTLTVANHCIFFDRTLSLDDYLQSQDRIHRISQKKQCFIYNFIIENSIDVWVNKLIDAKNNAARIVMGDINIDTFKDSMDYDFSAIMKSILYDNKEK